MLPARAETVQPVPGRVALQCGGEECKLNIITIQGLGDSGHVGMRTSRRHWGERHVTYISVLELIQAAAPMLSEYERSEIRRAIG